MRIVSLAPSHTEILFALGLGEQVVGVTAHCDHPSQALQKLKVGTFACPELTKIISLQPDLVLAGGNIHLSYVGELRRAGITVFNFEPRTVSDIFHVMKKIVEFTKTDEVGSKVVAMLRDKFKLIKEKTINHANPKVIFVMGEHSLMTPGPTSCQYDALRITGATLIPFTKNFSYAPITWEDIVNQDPDIILTCGRSKNEPLRKRCPGCKLVNRPCVRDVEYILNYPLLEKVTAIRTKRVYTIPCHFLCRPGPRLLDGMEKLTRLFQI